MRLLLDEMLSATVAAGLGRRGHDVVAVQNRAADHLRGIDDCLVLDHAAGERGAVVTDNVPDQVRCHRQRLETGRHRFGLLLFTNDTFPRHRHELFVSQVVAALDRELDAHPEDDDSSWVRWLRRS